MRSRTTAIAFASLLGSVVGVAEAREGDSDKCVAASEKGQEQRDHGALVAARASFRVCANDECPGVVRKDCAHWLEDVEQSLPTVVLGARDARGRDLEGVRIFIDGEAMESPESGRAVPLDPGRHTFRFERASSPPLVETAVLRMGERNRAVVVTFPDAPRAETLMKPASPASSVSPWVFVLGGVGAVGLGAFTYLAITGADEKSRVRDVCGNACTDDQVSGVRTRYIAADIALGVGVLSLAAAAYVFFTTKSSSPKATLRLAPAAVSF